MEPPPALENATLSLIENIQNAKKVTEKETKMSFLPTLLRRLTPTLCACTEPAIVTHGTPMYKDSHVVVVPA